MTTQKYLLLIATYIGIAFTAKPDNEVADSSIIEQNLQEVVVSATNGIHSKLKTSNTEIIGTAQLRRAACCNLGESFTLSPSVDVNYSDAATGAKQIKLLGLSGRYVQMLTENIPNLRGAAIPYSLSFIPGPWMQSIQVSKGASSVKNGYESITGQINIEFLKPQDIDGFRGNAYFDSRTKMEANADGNIHLNDRLSTALLLHFDNLQSEHDNNHDGFIDMPRQRQFNFINRWAFFSPNYISQLSAHIIYDKRTSGMSTHHKPEMEMPRYIVDSRTDRYELQWKNAIMFDENHNSSIALMLHGSIHDADNLFGNTVYNVNQKNGFAQLMFETDIKEGHNLAVGASLNHDRYKEYFDGTTISLPHNQSSDSETTTGIYAQYTFSPDNRLTIMPGVRYDYSNRYGGFVTPRLHIKFSPSNRFSLRASAGKGYRSPHALAENFTLLAGGRTLIVAENLRQEEAWNTGASLNFNFPVCGKMLDFNIEYYYTHFVNQVVMTVDGSAGPHTFAFGNLDGKSYSHTFQIDATYPFFEGLMATAAFRLNDTRATYDGVLRHTPLTPRYKGLLTLSYKTPTEIWQFDITGQLTGKGSLYNREEYPSYFQLQAQATREFRNFSIYIGGENLTNYRMRNPVIGADNPWSQSFDATQIWGPIDGAMAYIGIRLKFEHY